jgi:hypothetical protein
MNIKEVDKKISDFVEDNFGQAVHKEFAINAR